MGYEVLIQNHWIFGGSGPDIVHMAPAWGLGEVWSKIPNFHPLRPSQHLLFGICGFASFIAIGF